MKREKTDRELLEEVEGVDLRGWELLFGAGLAVYTAPSAADIRGALGRQTATTKQ